jgi:hypothetical protein
MPAISIMTPEQVDLIRQSFDAIWPVRRKLAVTFYGRFFELAPDAQQLFPIDMEQQHLKLMEFQKRSCCVPTPYSNRLLHCNVLRTR